jgi:hypothetical protein
MHHVLWEPRLGAERFFELYCETWRRSVLNLKGQKKWWEWIAHTRVRDWPHIATVLRRTQKMLDPAHYLHEHRLVAATGSVAHSRQHAGHGAHGGHGAVTPQQATTASR